MTTSTFYPDARKAIDLVLAACACLIFIAGYFSNEITWLIVSNPV